MPREKVSGWQPRSIRVDADDWKALEAEAARLRKTTKVCMSPSGLARLAIAKFCENLSSEGPQSTAPIDNDGVVSLAGWLQRDD